MDAAEAASSHAFDLTRVVVLLAAAVVAVPVFKRLGLGSVLGYIFAGIGIGPFGLALFADPVAILHTAELGVVMFLFVIGLEMEPHKLWSLRRQIFGLGVLQVSLCAAALTGVGVVLGFPLLIAFVFGVGFVLTSTAIVMQVLGERAALGTPSGEKMVSILLLEDLAIVPLLAFVAAMSPTRTGGEKGASWLAFGVALGALLVLVLLGRYLLNPVFRLLAASRAREVLTAAALLVVFGAAVLMEAGGLSMAMGAFLAGVLLSTSSFRHQLEADVEPFRGILLGLFFIAVGMSLDFALLAKSWRIVAVAVVAFMIAKAAVIFLIARLLRTSTDDALDRALLMSQGGEFAFVLYTASVSAEIIDGETSGLFSATVIVSMVLTPLVLAVVTRVMPKPKPSLDGVEAVARLSGRILVIGFGRFGQIATQGLLAMRCSVSIIDNDPDMIRAAEKFGFKVYYGDGTRLDILQKAGAEHVDAILVCVDDAASAIKITELVKHEFPLVKILARSFDRGHSIALVKLGVDFQIREVFESALGLGREALLRLEVPEEEVDAVIAEVRERDKKRFELQLLGSAESGRELLFSNAAESAREQGIGSPE